MDVASFVEGPLIWLVFSLFFLAILLRFSFFLAAISRSTPKSPRTWKYFLATFPKPLLPLHKAFKKRPFYSLSRYLFHICLFLVPIGLYGHIVMLESSALQLSWPALPDNLADWMTLLLILLALGFLVRRTVIGEVRRGSTVFDYLFILFTALPFITGYALAHGTLDASPFFADNMLTIHILTSLIMVLGAVFLFLRSRLDLKKCTGCAACESECPTGTLAYRDENKQRVFTYSHYQCVSCGACVNACPEGAAELRHEMGFRKLFQVMLKERIRSVDLKVCQRCGALFAPEPQWNKLAQDSCDDYMNFCATCKRYNFASTLRSPKLSSREPAPAAEG
jgi:Pyruvate/2-oxoacid:ferredoxin oxidoreductase delta subunit